MVKRTAGTFLAVLFLISRLGAQTQPAAFSKDLFLARVTLDVARNKASRIEGATLTTKRTGFLSRLSFATAIPTAPLTA